MPRARFGCDLPDEAVDESGRSSSSAHGVDERLHLLSSRLGAGGEILGTATLGGSDRPLRRRDAACACVLTGGRSAMEQSTDRAPSKPPPASKPIDLSGKTDLLTLAALVRKARLLVTVDSAPMHFAAALGHAAGRPVRPDESVSLASPLGIGHRFAGRNRRAGDGIHPETARRADEPNLDASGDRCYGSAAVGSGGTRAMSDTASLTKAKPSFWQTDPHRLAAVPAALRLCKAVSSGVSSWASPSAFSSACITALHAAGPGKVTSVIFQGGAPSAPSNLPRTPPLLNAGPKMDSSII